MNEDESQLRPSASSGPGDFDDDARIFEELYPSLRRFAAVVRPPEIEPDDLVQEALVRTLSVRPLAACEDPGAYLRTTMVRLAANHRRGLGRRRRAESRLDRADAISQPVYPSDLAELRRIDPRDRAVLYLVLVDGLTYRDAGHVLQCSEDAARKRLTRAVQRLRVELTEEQHDA